MTQLIASDPFSPGYVCQKPWPDGTKAQCGYIELFPENEGEQKVFFESFPIGMNVLRGQAFSFEEAESIAFNKYLKRSQCKEHEYKPHGTSGLGKCIHCDLITSSVFPPQHICKQCGKPEVNFVITKGFMSTEYYCYEHYKQQNREILNWPVKDIFDFEQENQMVYSIALKNYFVIHFFEDSFIADKDYISGDNKMALYIRLSRLINNAIYDNKEKFTESGLLPDNASIKEFNYYQDLIPILFIHSLIKLNDKELIRDLMNEKELSSRVINQMIDFKATLEKDPDFIFKF